MSVCQECLNDEKKFLKKVFLEMDYEKDYDLRFGNFCNCSRFAQASSVVSLLVVDEHIAKKFATFSRWVLLSVEGVVNSDK
jgi:predicted nucleic acid-binding Zn finger protein